MATSEQHEDLVDLGFPENCERKILLSSLFLPSKIGGKPAWLDLKALPAIESLKCRICSEQMIFLCQIYVPTEFESTPYHRMLYLFCCKNGKCAKEQKFVKAFRCQKPDELDDTCQETDSDAFLEEKLKILESTETLCNLCGCYGDKICSSCREVYYCCKDHQVIDWKTTHKRRCRKNHNNNDVNNVGKENNPTLLFTEYEIVIESEPTEKNNTKSDNDVKKLYNDYITKKNATDTILEKDLEKVHERNVDKYFMKFKETIDIEPEQILRYQLGGKPLWVSCHGIPKEEDIPNCSCGSKRQFEFQVLPQMLNHLGVETTVDSIDWGVLCIYTCVENCMTGLSYKEEFVWKQDFSADDVIH